MLKLNSKLVRATLYHTRQSRDSIILVNCGNLFSQIVLTLEFNFEEKCVFETSKIKNPSKITTYTVYKVKWFFKKFCCHNMKGRQLMPSCFGVTHQIL